MKILLNLHDFQLENKNKYQINYNYHEKTHCSRQLENEHNSC